MSMSDEATDTELRPGPPDDPGARRRRGSTGSGSCCPPPSCSIALFVVAPVAGTLSGKLSSVTENDQAAFLPDSAESTKSLELETRFAGDQDIPALIVWERAERADRGRPGRGGRGRRRGSSAVDGVAGPAVADRSRARTARRSRSSLPLPGDNSAFETLPGIVEDVTAAAEVEGLPSYVTGPGGQFADFAAAFEGIDGNLLFTTVGVILVILLLIYRSPVFLPVLISAGLALVARAGRRLPAGRSRRPHRGRPEPGHPARCSCSGPSTDYALLLISRFKEELHREDSWTVAMRAALQGCHPADRRLRRHRRSSACSACCCPTSTATSRSGPSARSGSPARSSP